MRKKPWVGQLTAVGLVGMFASGPVSAPAIAQTNAKQAAVVSQGLQFSIANIKLLGKSVVVQVLVKNISNAPQYLMYCITNSSGATLTSMQRLSVTQQSIVGLPSVQWANIGECLSTTKLDDMTRLEPDSSLLVAIGFSDPDNKDIASDNTISFPLDLVVRTGATPGPMDTTGTQKEPGLIHKVDVSFLLKPLN